MCRRTGDLCGGKHPVGDARRPVRQTGCDAQFTPLRSRSALADHLHTDAVTEITFITPSPVFGGFPSWGKWSADSIGQ